VPLRHRWDGVLETEAHNATMLERYRGAASWVALCFLFWHLYYPLFFPTPKHLKTGRTGWKITDELEAG